jgi:hypothetical protein
MDGVKTKSKETLLFYPVFCARRILFCIAAFGMHEIPAQQVQFLMYINLAVFMYKVYFKPLEWRLQNYIDLFNEATICVCTMHLLFFTDWVADLEVRYAYGWSMIVIMCINFLVNAIVVLWFAGKKLYLLMSKLQLHSKYKKWRNTNLEKEKAEKKSIV